MTTTAPSEPRVVGRRRNPSRRVTFTLLAYDGDKEHPYSLTARASMDTGSVFGLADDKATPGERVGALRRLLSRQLLDDDGVSAHAVPRQVQETPQDTAEQGSSTALVVVDDDLSAVDLADTAWRLGVYDEDDETWSWSEDSFPSASIARQSADRNPSSLRRFSWLMDHPVLAVDQSALEEIIDLVVTEGADRPTEPSAGSPRSSRRKKG